MLEDIGVAAPDPETESRSLRNGASNRNPLPLHDRLLSALAGAPPSRKTDIAVMMGISRGSANRIVDKAVALGDVVMAEPGRYALNGGSFANANEKPDVEAVAKCGEGTAEPGIGDHSQAASDRVPGGRKALTGTRPSPFYDRLLSALVGAPPSRKTDIAALIGVDRGRVNRAVEKGIWRGAIVEVEPGRYGLKGEHGGHLGGQRLKKVKRQPAAKSASEAAATRSAKLEKEAVARAVKKQKAKEAKEKAAVAKAAKKEKAKEAKEKAAVAKAAKKQKAKEKATRKSSAKGVKGFKRNAEPIVVRPRLAGSIAERVRSILAEHGELHVAQLRGAIRGVGSHSVGVELFRMCKGGTVESVSRGRYRLRCEFGVVADAVAGPDAVYRAVERRWLGEAWTAMELVGETGAPYQVVASLLSVMARAGTIRRVSKGIYAKNGAEPVLVGKGNYTFRVLQAMAKAADDRIWSTAEMSETAFAGVFTKKNAMAIVMHNLSKRGLIGRVGLTKWRLMPKGREQISCYADPGRVEAKIWDHIVAGEIWRAEDLAAQMDTSVRALTPMLEALEREGRVVHVAYGRWRGTQCDADLKNADLSALRTLGQMLEVRELRWTEMGAHARRRLQDEGICESAGRGVYRVNDGWRLALGSRLSVSQRAAVGEREGKLLRALRHSGPLDRDGISATAGMDRAASDQIVDGMLSAGRLLEVRPGRYMIA